MNIGIVTVWQERGAGYVSRQYRDILAKKHTVFIYARGYHNSSAFSSSWQQDPSVTWDNAPFLSEHTSVNRRQFCRWLKEKNIDVVFFNEQYCFLVPLLCKEMGIRTGAYVDYYTESTLPLWEIYDFIICNTRRHASAFRKFPQMRYVPWGTDLSLFRPEKNPSPVSKLVFFHSAGMSPDRKGTAVLLEAFSRISRKNCCLLIHTQTALPVEAAAAVKMLQEEGSLTVIQKTVPAPGLYHLGDVYVYPARLDGIGLSIAEALACGLPAVLPDQPPMNEFIDPDRCFGYLIPVRMQYARSDGYYWPQCGVEAGDLAEILQNIADGRIPRASREEVRRFAEKTLNWNDREGRILEIFENAPFRPSFEDVRNKILEFERKRSERELKCWLNDSSRPVLFLLRLFRRFVNWFWK